LGSVAIQRFMSLGVASQNDRLDCVGTGARNNRGRLKLLM